MSRLSGVGSHLRKAIPPAVNRADQACAGDEDVKAELEQSIPAPSTFNLSHLNPLLALQISNLSAVRASSQKATAAARDAYNPFEGNSSAKQLNESIDAFFSRLPPLTTRIEDAGPWIRVADPHASTHRLTDEDWAGVTEQSEKQLAKLTEQRETLEQQMKGKAKATITRAYNKKRVQVEQSIREVAKEKNCTTGKWMFFPSPENLDDVWKVIATTIVKGELGPTAKVATKDEKDKRESRVICVYTKDFGDVEDVHRVLRRLVHLGLVSKEDRGIYYKSDIWTHLGINAGNEWGIPASQYWSHKLMGWK